MDQVLEAILSFFANQQFFPNSIHFQIIVGIILLLLLTTLIIAIKNRSKKNKITALENELFKEKEEKRTLINQNKLQTEQYEALSKEKGALFTLAEQQKQSYNSLLKDKENLDAKHQTLQAELNKTKENAESDLNTSRAIIKKHQEDYSKLNQTFLKAQEQVRRETQENFAFDKKNKELEEVINNLQHNLAQAIENNQLQLTKVTILEDELSLYQKKKAEEEKRRQSQNNIQDMKNLIYQCFQNIEHPVFDCYRSEETKGTYLHVKQVAQLSYYAAISIGANSDYSRASALFHDLGKTPIYKYFKENWPHNKNQKLEAENFSFTFTHRGNMISSHVDKGLEVFREITKNMPADVSELLNKQNINSSEKNFIYEEAKEELQKSILEHQAKSHIRMLYEEAKKNGEICKPEDFAYTVGQIPSNREQGIICLADSCEAAFSSRIHESEEQVASLISKVISGRLNEGHMNNSGLSARDIQLIQKTFTEYLTEIWKSKRPDRLEDEVAKKGDEYSIHDSGNELIRQMILKFSQDDIKEKRKVICAFLDRKAKTLDAINLEELMQPIEDLLKADIIDIVLGINCLVALTTYYKHMASQIIQDIQKHHPINFYLNRETTVDLELVQNSDILAYIDAKPILKQYLNRMQAIRETLTSAMRKLRLYESPDTYVIKWATQIDNYLNNQSNIPESLDKNEKIEVFSQLQNVVTTPEDFSQFIDCKQETIYININLDIFRCDCKFIQFIVYFYNHKMQPIVDQGGMFCTKTTQQVAILQSFLIKNAKFFSIKESAIVLPLSELHLSKNHTKPINARVQIHGIRSDDQPILLFDRTEEFTLASFNSLNL